jgi:hypothetical protein
MTSTIQDSIIVVLEQNDGELKGTEELALTLNAPKNWTIKCVRILEASGQIQIIPGRGGRGHRTVYKRNRNQPGIPMRKQQ